MYENEDTFSMPRTTYEEEKEDLLRTRKWFKGKQSNHSFESNELKRIKSMHQEFDYDKEDVNNFTTDDFL